MNDPASPDAVARHRFIDADRLTLPLNLLAYVSDRLGEGYARCGFADFQETFDIYLRVIDEAIEELHRLQDQAKAGDRS